MVKKRYKPKELNEDQNPFVSDFRFEVVKHYDMQVLSDVGKIKYDSGTVVGLEGETHTKSVQFFTEQDRGRTEYATHGDCDLDAVRDSFSGGALRMYEYIKQKLKKNKTIVHIDSSDYMQRYDVKSYTTFIRYRTELVDHKVIVQSSASGWFWVNPAFVYCGSRIIAFNDKKVVKAVIGKPKET